MRRRGKIGSSQLAFLFSLIFDTPMVTYQVETLLEHQLDQYKCQSYFCNVLFAIRFHNKDSHLQFLKASPQKGVPKIQSFGPLGCTKMRSDVGSFNPFTEFPAHCKNDKGTKRRPLSMFRLCPYHLKYL